MVSDRIHYFHFNETFSKSTFESIKTLDHLKVSSLPFLKQGTDFWTFILCLHVGDNYGTKITTAHSRS